MEINKVIHKFEQGWVIAWRKKYWGQIYVDWKIPSTSTSTSGSGPAITQPSVLVCVCRSCGGQRMEGGCDGDDCEYQDVIRWGMFWQQSWLWWLGYDCKLPEHIIIMIMCHAELLHQHLLYRYLPLLQYYLKSSSKLIQRCQYANIFYLTSAENVFILSAPLVTSLLSPANISV